MRHYFFARINGRYVKIHFRDILYVEGCKNYLKIITGKKSYLVLLAMKRMEQLLPASMFVRIHKSYIVSLEHVTEFERETVFLNDKSLPVGNQYRGVMERSVLLAQEEMMGGLMTLPLNFLTAKAVAG